MSPSPRLGRPAFLLVALLGACGGSAFTDGSGGASPTSTSSGATTGHGTTVGAGGATSTSGDSSVEASATGATTGTGGSGGTSGAGGASASSTTGGGPCDACQDGTTCCSDVCRNTSNDVLNCGGCGVGCLGEHPFCNNGVCDVVPCNDIQCFTGFCCGSTCCNDGELCCDVPGPGPSTGPKCFNPADSGGTCPVGCTVCQ